LIGFGTVLRWMFGAKRETSIDSGKQVCPWCDQKSPAGTTRCDWCGRPLGSPLGESARDLATLAKLLHQFRNQPWLSSEQADRMIEAIVRQRQRCATVRPPVRRSRRRPSLGRTRRSRRLRRSPAKAAPPVVAPPVVAP